MNDNNMTETSDAFKSLETLTEPTPTEPAEFIPLPKLQMRTSDAFKCFSRGEVTTPSTGSTGFTRFEQPPRRIRRGEAGLKHAEKLDDDICMDF